MNPKEVLRLVDTLHREKDIDTEVVFTGLEAALLSAARKHLGASENVQVRIDRQTGAIIASDGGRPIDPSELGRIAAQTAKQVMIQKIREAERESISREFADKVHTVVTGTIQRFEGPNLVVNLPRTEGFLPKSEQIPGESFHVGERIRALVLEVRTIGSRVRVVLSRSHAEFVRRLFELEVPEIAEGVVVIKGIAREAGSRTKIAVVSRDPRVDCVGACVGVQGSRIQSIRDELNGEKIDIVPWSENIHTFVANALRPAELLEIEIDEDARRALVLVSEDQLSLAIGKRGQNVRLAARLTGLEIDIKSSAAEGEVEGAKPTAEATEGSPADAPRVTVGEAGLAAPTVPAGEQPESMGPKPDEAASDSPSSAGDGPEE